MFCRARLYKKVHNFYLEFIHLSGVLLTPGSEHRSQAGERRGVLLQQAELIPELRHAGHRDALGGLQARSAVHQELSGSRADCGLPRGRDHQAVRG